MPGVVREQIRLQILIQHVEKHACAIFWSNRGNQLHLAVYIEIEAFVIRKLHNILSMFVTCLVNTQW